MSIRDLLLNILIGLGVAAFIIVVSVIDSLPFWVLLILAVCVWIAYIIIVIRDHAKDIKYPILRYRPRSQRTRRPIKTSQPTNYDQEEVN